MACLSSASPNSNVSTDIGSSRAAGPVTPVRHTDCLVLMQIVERRRTTKRRVSYVNLPDSYITPSYNFLASRITMSVVSVTDELASNFTFHSVV
ncbi:hypothetical protein J6590_001158 [Homalodisca vitripennis]|nr:hypothetical protein J6590_001158 [Homalodisca vitripennis]